MGQCWSAPFLEESNLHGRETEEKYRAKWNDIGFDNARMVQIKAVGGTNGSGVTTTTTVRVWLVSLFWGVGVGLRGVTHTNNWMSLLPFVICRLMWV